MIDWHNYSHTILSMSLSPSHPLVTMTHILETLFGRVAQGGFCVTEAMRQVGSCAVALGCFLNMPVRIMRSSPACFLNMLLRILHHAQ